MRTILVNDKDGKIALSFRGTHGVLLSKSIPLYPPTMKHPLRLLLIEDSEDDAELLLAEIKGGGFAVTHRRVESAKGTIDALVTGQWDMVISDYNMPQFNGMAALEIVRQHDPDLPFLVISGDIGEDIAVDAMRAGARDYMMKNNLSRLVPAISRELHESTLRRDARQAHLQLEENEARFRAMTSNIPGMVFQLIAGAGGGLVQVILGGKVFATS